MTLRGVLLDLDGTIADSIDFFYGITCEVLAEAALPAPERAAVLEAISQGVPPHERFFPEDFEGREDFLERMIRTRWPSWAERYGTEIRPLPGACEAVTELRRRGLALGLVTSSYGELPFLDRWGIRELFSAIVCRQDVVQIKPHPEAVVTALRRLELAPFEVVSVGDTPLDVRAARAVGVSTIAVLSGAGTAAQLRAEGASAVLDSIVELPDFLARGFSGKDRGT